MDWVAGNVPFCAVSCGVWQQSYRVVRKLQVVGIKVYICIEAPTGAESLQPWSWESGERRGCRCAGLCNCWLFAATVVVTRVSNPRPRCPGDLLPEDWWPDAAPLPSHRTKEEHRRLQLKSMSSQVPLPEGGRDRASKRRSWGTCPPSWRLLGQFLDVDA